MEIDHNIYDTCCLFDTFRNCGPTSQTKQRKKLNWPDRCIDFGTLSTIDVTPYLISLGMISKWTNRMIMSEKQLIMNRIASYTSNTRNSTLICPLHRYTYGTHWQINKNCGHSDHPSGLPKPKSDRRAKLDIAKSIPGFIYGSGLCSKHRTNEKESNYDNETSATDDDNDCETSAIDDELLTMITDVDEKNISVDNIKRFQFNTILCETTVSPLKSSVVIPFEEQSESSLRRLTSKYKRGLEALTEEYAEAIAPTQGYKLIRLAEQSNVNKENNYEKESTLDIIQQLKLLYNAYVVHKIPFREQVQLLSLLPLSWSYTKIIVEFNCSKYAVKLAKKLRKQADYEIEPEPDGKQHRERVDSSVAEHFISWLVSSGSLVSGTYGLTKIKMDDGNKIQLPKQILQSQKYHIIMQYKKHCADTSFNGYGVRKLYDLLKSINPSQNHAVAGLDEFLNDGIEAWKVLKDMIEKFPIPQIDKKRLQKQIDMGLLYQKHGYAQHCQENASCSFHCINFALSDIKIKEFQSPCSVAHTEKCSDCENVFCTLAEIESHISDVIDSENRDELSYDFHNATESIMELFRHKLRGVCQDNEKSNIINNLSMDSTFAIFDWGQKIIPQRYRESQKDYYGKKGLSILVGSFVIRNNQTIPTTKPINATTTTTTTTSSPDNAYITSTYIVSLTVANQNDIDTLSATQLIIEKFHADHPHIKYIFKRTDNAGNFSSHSTAEAEYLICKKFGLDLVIRDYSEVQMGKEVCDRMCGVAKSRMRSWIHSGHDLLNGFDVKEGMQAYGGIKNLQIAVAEVVEGEGYLSQSLIPNVSSVRSIRYSTHGMFIHKASGIGSGLYIPFKNIKFDPNMKLLSDFNTSINKNSIPLIQSSREDRLFNETHWCPIDNCVMVFNNMDDLNLHIISNQHQLNNDPKKKQSSNDAARMYLMQSLKTIHVNTANETSGILQQQSSFQTTTTSTFSINKFINYLNCDGWALRLRKPGQRISQDVKDFIEKIWKDGQRNGIKIKPEFLYDKIRRERNSNNEKLFKTNQYISVAQIKYQIKKLYKKYNISVEQQLINDLLIQTATASTT